MKMLRKIIDCESLEMMKFVLAKTSLQILFGIYTESSSLKKKKVYGAPAF